MLLRLRRGRPDGGDGALQDDWRSTGAGLRCSLPVTMRETSSRSSMSFGLRLAALPDRLAVRGRPVRLEIAELQQVRPAEDRCHRRAQLVREIGEELVLGAICFLSTAVETRRCPRRAPPAGPVPRRGRRRFASKHVRLAVRETSSRQMSFRGSSSARTRNSGCPLRAERLDDRRRAPPPSAPRR